MKKHHLKCLAQFFQLAWDKKKPVEIRWTGDRHFEVGDQVFLHELSLDYRRFSIHKELYSGRWIGNVITHIITKAAGLQEGYAFLILDQVIFQDGSIDADAITITTPPVSAGLPKGDIES